MRKAENTFKKYLLKKMGTRWSVQSHEDRFSIGVPDLSYGAEGVNGWIELKQLKDWPKREATKVPLKSAAHFSVEQVNWLLKRGKKGGNCYLLVKVGQEYFLFDYTKVQPLWKGLTQDTFREQCLGYWKSQIDPVELIRLLSLGKSPDELSH